MKTLLFLTLPILLILNSCGPVAPARGPVNVNDPLRGTWIHKKGSTLTVMSYDGRGNVNMTERYGSKLDKGRGFYKLSPNGLLKEVDSKTYKEVKENHYKGLTLEERTAYYKVKFIRDGYFQKSVVSSPISRPGGKFDTYRFSKNPMVNPFEAMAWADSNGHLRRRSAGTIDDLE